MNFRFSTILLPNQFYSIKNNLNYRVEKFNVLHVRYAGSLFHGYSKFD